MKGGKRDVAIELKAKRLRFERVEVQKIGAKSRGTSFRELGPPKSGIVTKPHRTIA
jgi:hypothetical protein